MWAAWWATLMRSPEAEAFSRARPITTLVACAVVALAERAGKPLNQLSLADLQSVDKTFGREALKVFDLRTAMARRRLPGAPGTKPVRTQLARWRKQLDALPTANRRPAKPR